MAVKSRHKVSDMEVEWKEAEDYIKEPLRYTEHVVLWILLSLVLLYFLSRVHYQNYR